MTSGRTILVVDDQADILRIYSRALEVAGHRVQIAGTAEAAMQLVEAAPPDAILLDLSMPFINGMGLLYRLRKGHPGIPVAIVTGTVDLDQDAIDEIGTLGAALHFKPVSVTELQAIVENLLHNPAT
jgi:DNA-binding NtrC family response regulator